MKFISGGVQGGDLQKTDSVSSSHESFFVRERREGGESLAHSPSWMTDNIGHKLLVKAGWKEGSGLGRDEQVSQEERRLINLFIGLLLMWMTTLL